ncbi:RagB/SusD family nutrient uptake outer membrane protein [Bacteroides sp.]|jgi:tetratricopeptide (TPR) repeat protein|uniref:RagB/SusD family nutrient uptake outer membrane protein n=1 Tax=Bacteroides sp. TaxID=29523 RepID=UPI00338EF55F
MKKIKNIALIGMIAAGALCSSCSEDFLKPDPLSFYEPEQTFTTEAGLRSVVATLDRHLRNYWTYYQAANLVTPFYTLFMHTDLAVAGKTDQSTIWADPSERLTPSDGMGGGGSEVNQFSYFWGETYTGIKSANTITSYIGKIKDMDEASRNKYIGWAYFHRAYRYLSLVFMFKDVPLVTKIIEGPKFDYKTTSREAILAKMVEDMEFAVQWVPEQKDMKEIGLVNKGACRMLLSKLYLATGQWEKAIQQLNEVIDNSGYSFDDEYLWYFCHSFQYRNVAYSTQCDLGFAPT